MKIVFTFEWDVLQTRAMEWYNFLSSLGHEVYLLNPSELSKQIFAIHKTNVKYVYDEKFIEECDYWFYDLACDNTKVQTPSPFLDRMKLYKGTLFCISYEDGYVFFARRIDSHIMYKTSMFIGNALYLERGWYNRYKERVFLTTSYITNSQPFKTAGLWVPPKDRKDRVYFSGALTGFPTYLTDNDEDEYYLRYTLCKIVADSGIDHIIRFAACDPRLKDLYDEVVPTSWKHDYIEHLTYVKELSESRFCLAVKGNSYPTNRFYEAQAASCVALTTPLHGEVEFYGTGQAGKDYVEINADGSDLVEKVRYYIDHKDEAIQIAENGRRNWEIHNMLDERGVWPEKTFNYHVDGIKAITGIDITKV
jgi:hypothetical protein